MRIPKIRVKFDTKWKERLTKSFALIQFPVLDDLTWNQMNPRSEGKQAILCDFTCAVVVGQKIAPPQPGPLGRLVNKRTHTWRDAIFCTFCASCLAHSWKVVTFSQNYFQKSRHWSTTLVQNMDLSKPTAKPNHRSSDTFSAPVNEESYFLGNILRAINKRRLCDIFLQCIYTSQPLFKRLHFNCLKLPLFRIAMYWFKDF